MIDFTLFNCFASGLESVFILGQYQAGSLRCHLRAAWSRADGAEGPVLLTPAHSTGRYRGTADAVYQSLEHLDPASRETVLILAGDHVYRADYRGFTAFHHQTGAQVTILTSQVDATEASSFGVLQVAGDGRVLSFVEKPADPRRLAEDGKCTINLGVYCFDRRFLLDGLSEDACRDGSHDFGRDLLPRAVESGAVFSCPLEEVSPDPRPYWRDVGTIDSFFQAHLNLLGVSPAFELRDPRWPDGNAFTQWLPAKHPATAKVDGREVRGWNLVSRGAVLESSDVVNCVLSPGTWVEAGARLEECLLFPGARVGRGVRLRRVIIEEGVRVPEGTALRLRGGSSPRVFGERQAISSSSSRETTEWPADAGKVSTAAENAPRGLKSALSASSGKSRRFLPSSRSLQGDGR